jgi:hypothetical protein
MKKIDALGLSSNSQFNAIYGFGGDPQNMMEESRYQDKGSEFIVK